MPKLEFEVWVCGDVQCGCNEARLYLDSVLVVAESDTFITYSDSKDLFRIAEGLWAGTGALETSKPSSTPAIETLVALPNSS